MSETLRNHYLTYIIQDVRNTIQPLFKIYNARCKKTHIIIYYSRHQKHYVNIIRDALFQMSETLGLYNIILDRLFLLSATLYTHYLRYITSDVRNTNHY